MALKKFTQEEMDFLKSNPCVLEVAPHKVCLSREFKEVIWKRLEQGEDIHAILEEFNLPCALLGETRINGIRYLVRKEGRAGKGFRDVHTLECLSNGYKSPEKQIELLKMQLEYKDQEIEFLKKLVSLGQEESIQ